MYEPETRGVGTNPRLVGVRQAVWEQAVISVLSRTTVHVKANSDYIYDQCRAWVLRSRLLRFFGGPLVAVVLFAIAGIIIIISIYQCPEKPSCTADDAERRHNDIKTRTPLVGGLGRAS